MKNELTTKNYWEEYYSGAYNGKGVKDIVNICSYYDVIWNKFFTHDTGESKTLLEIGGYPGRYLAYLSKKYNLIPTCLDYNSDDAEIKNVFRMFGVEEFYILKEDIFKYKNTNKYDYLFSNGFIEHFEDYDKVLDLHMNYLKPDGYLLIMIPNKRGYKRFYQELADRDNLKHHNLKCMRKSVFKSFARRNNLDIVHLSYFGEFGFNVHGETNLFREFMVRSHRLLFKRFLNKLIKRYPNRMFGDVIVGIFKKNRL